MFTLLDEIADSVFILRPLRDESGALADFAMIPKPGYVDPAGRLPAERPDPAGGIPLVGSAGRPVRSRQPGCWRPAVPSRSPASTAPLTGGDYAVGIADLRVAPFFAGVICTWRKLGEPERLADLLGNAQRLGQIGGWDENLTTGTVRWTNAAFALFGLDRRRLPRSPSPTCTTSSSRRTGPPSSDSARRCCGPGTRRRGVPHRPARRHDGQADPGGRPSRPRRRNVVALRGAFQDVSAHYQTQVALAATRDQLADSEQRAAEEHLLALRLQRAIMPPDVSPAAAAGVDVAVRYRPAEAGRLVSGDWYDTLLLPGKDLLLVVGDITGHGIEAVTGMVAARNALRGLVATGAGPGELLRHLNYSACHLTEGIAGTVVCGRYDRTPGWRWAEPATCRRSWRARGRRQRCRCPAAYCSASTRPPSTTRPSSSCRAATRCCCSPTA